MPGPETAIAVRDRRAARTRLLSGLRGNRRRRIAFNTSILVDRQGTASSANIAKSIYRATPSTEPQRALFSIWRSVISSRAILAFRYLAHDGRRVGHVHLQRPALAGDLSRHGTCRASRSVLLGYNTPVGHTGYPDVDGLSNFPQPSVDAGGRLSERDMGDRHGQMRRGGRIVDDRPERHHRAFRRDRRLRAHACTTK